MSSTVPQKTGYFSGHAVAGTGFICFGIFFLILALHRARRLPPGVAFAEAHIPERNPAVLGIAGSILVVFTLFGILLEAPGYDDMIAPATHTALYMTFLFVGSTALLEGQNRLPPDSVRGAMVLCMILHYVIWNEHAQTKQLAADYRVHAFLAHLCLVAAAIVAYSVRYPHNTLAYILQPGISILIGLWLYTAGVYVAFLDIPAGMMGIVLVWETLAVSVLILLGFAFCLPSHMYENTEKGIGSSMPYSVVSSTEDGDEQQPQPTKDDIV